MNVKRNRVKLYPVYETIYKRDKQASTYVEYSFIGFIPCIVYGDSGEIKIGNSGIKVEYSQKIKVAGKYEIGHNDKNQKYYKHENGCVLQENYVIHIDNHVHDVRKFIPDDYKPDHKITSIISGRYLHMEVDKL